jgi:hypothetical protein
MPFVIEERATPIGIYLCDVFKPCSSVAQLRPSRIDRDAQEKGIVQDLQRAAGTLEENENANTYPVA